MMMIKPHKIADKLGNIVLRMLVYMRSSLDLSLESWVLLVQLKWLTRPAVKHVMVRQLYFTGVQAFFWVLAASAMVGVLVIYTIVDFARQVQDLTLIGSLFGGVFLQEIAPMLIAIFLLVRSGVAVVTEVGNIQTRGEPLVLASLGINENEYLYMPRLMAFAVSGLILTFLFAFLSVWFGGLVVALTNTLTFSEFIFELRHGVGFFDIVIMVLKSLCYPVLMVLVLISQGHKVGDDPNQIPVRATYGMLGSLASIIVLDIMIGIVEKII